MTKPSEPGVLPSSIGRYEILRELGRGAMGVVYEAFDPTLGRTIALKTIHPSALLAPGDREDYESRFFTEARIAARLSHPGIVVVHDFDRDTASGDLFIALEHLKGRTLAELTRGATPLPWREALRLGGSMAHALAHAHAQGVVHRDMKPANVMVLASGEVKIMDFGIAKIDSLAKLTLPGETLGTPLYMSPEQARGEEVTARSDIFSLGSILYTLVTGRPAFAAESVPRILGKVVNDEPVPPSRLAGGLPSTVDRVLARAMTKAPEERYPQALALAEDLEDVLAGVFPRHLLGEADAQTLGGTRIATPKAEPRYVAAGTPPGTGTEVELVLAEDDALESALHALTKDVPAAPPPVRTLSRPPAPEAAPSRPRRAGLPLLALGGVLVVLAGVLYWWNRETAPAAGGGALPRSPDPAAATPTPGPAPDEALHALSPGADSGRLAVDFEHPLRSGQLRIWVDEELVLEQKLAGEVSKKVVFSFRKGSVQESLEVSPGRHTIRAQVVWEDNQRTESIVGTFKPGVTRHLAIRLGRIRKNLSLDWN